MFQPHHASACALLFCSFASVVITEDPTPISDQEFVTKALSSELFEVESSKLAKKSAKKEELKTFADKMIAEHGKEKKDLKEAAKTAGLDIPTKMTVSDQKMLTKIWEAQQSNFDQVYLEFQVKAHEEAVSLYTRAARTAKDPALRKFAEKTLPSIEEHYAHIKRCAKDNQGG